MGIPDLRNLYSGQEATVRTGHGTTDWFQIRKGECQGYILSLCWFNICRAHHAKCWARWSTSWNQDCWEKYQKPKIRTILMAESEEEINSILMKEKEESEKAGLKLSIQKRSWHPVPSGGQSIGSSASVLPMNIQDWFPLGLTGLISLLSKGL